MRQLLYTFFLMATAALFSCGNNTLHGEHYDTTLVDTMLAMVPGGSDDSDATPLQWTYNADSTLPRSRAVPTTSRRLRPKTR